MKNHIIGLILMLVTSFIFGQNNDQSNESITVPNQSIFNTPKTEVIILIQERDIFKFDDYPQPPSCPDGTQAGVLTYYNAHGDWRAVATCPSDTTPGGNTVIATLSCYYCVWQPYTP